MTKDLIKVVGGNGQVSATVLKHSVSKEGKEMISFEIEYPRIILSELNTHRMLSKNSSSSRAIPVKKVNQMISENPAMPVRFGQHQAGMQDQGEEYNEEIYTYGEYLSGRDFWKKAAQSAVEFSNEFLEAGYAKQICNRLTEPFQRMKTVLSGTELANFFWLRIDHDADPTIHALALCIQQAKEKSTPELLKAGEWHLPYVDTERDKSGVLLYSVGEGEDKTYLNVEDAKAVSSSACAQVSYRTLNKTKEKALDIYEKLISSEKVHSSPTEHQASPMEVSVAQSIDDFGKFIAGKLEGVTHINQKGEFCSGNLIGWTQHRQLLDNHTKW